MSWEKIKLGELYEVHNGLSKGRQFFGSGYPFLSFSTVFNNWFLPKALSDLVQSSDKERESYSILRGDIFITRTSETMHELGMSSVALRDYPNATYNGFTKRLRPIDSQRILPEFIGYYLRCSEFRNQFVAFSTMTTRASLRNEDLLSIEVPVPPMPTQRRIADILSAYDDLIENNRKQIKLLEEAAQRLYKEWFVDLRFPGHAHTKIVDGVPEGWRNIRLSDVTDINPNSISKDYPFDYIEYTDLSSVQNGIIKETTRYSLADAPGRAKRIANDGDVIWGMVRPNLKSFALVLNPKETDVFSTGFCVISPKSVPFSYLYYAVTTENFIAYLVNCTNGAAYPAVKPIHFAEANFLCPDNRLLDRFNAIVEPMLRKREKMLIMINQAQQARDRLLPKLMSGEVEV